MSLRVSWGDSDNTRPRGKEVLGMPGATDCHSCMTMVMFGGTDYRGEGS